MRFHFSASDDGFSVLSGLIGPGAVRAGKTVPTFKSSGAGPSTEGTFAAAVDKAISPPLGKAQAGAFHDDSMLASLNEPSLIHDEPSNFDDATLADFPEGTGAFTQCTSDGRTKGTEPPLTCDPMCITHPLSVAAIGDDIAQDVAGKAPPAGAADRLKPSGARAPITDQAVGADRRKAGARAAILMPAGPEVRGLPSIGALSLEKWRNAVAFSNGNPKPHPILAVVRQSHPAKVEVPAIGKQPRTANQQPLDASAPKLAVVAKPSPPLPLNQQPASMPVSHDPLAAEAPGSSGVLHTERSRDATAHPNADMGVLLVAPLGHQASAPNARAWTKVKLLAAGAARTPAPTRAASGLRGTSDSAQSPEKTPESADAARALTAPPIGSAVATDLIHAVTQTQFCDIGVDAVSKSPPAISHSAIAADDVQAASNVSIPSKDQAGSGWTSISADEPSALSSEVPLTGGIGGRNVEFADVRQSPQLALASVAASSATSTSLARVSVGSVPSQAADAAGTVRQIAAAAVKCVKMGAGQQVTLLLSPQELGRMQMRIQLHASGAAVVDVAIERPTTLALLRHNLPDLQAALDRAGVSVGGGQPAIHLSGPSHFAATSLDAKPLAGSLHLSQPSGGDEHNSLKQEYQQQDQRRRLPGNAGTSTLLVESALSTVVAGNERNGLDITA